MAVSNKSGGRLLVILLIMAAVLYPILAAFRLSIIDACTSFFAEDAYYYFTIARNSSLDFTTFDHVTRTNGFHPLWQYFLIVLFKGIHTPLEQQQAVFVISAILVAAGICCAGLGIYRLTQSRFLPLLLVPGAFYTLFDYHWREKGMSYQYSIWSMINGLETPLTIFFGGILLMMLCRLAEKLGNASQEAVETDEARRDVTTFFTVRVSLATGLLLSCLLLSRLDDIFLLVGFTVFILCWREPWLRKFYHLGMIAGIPAGALAAYLLHNHATMGLWMPVSGANKIGASLWPNLRAILLALFPAAEIEGQSPDEMYFIAKRGLPLLVPVLTGVMLLGALWAGWRKRRISPLLWAFTPLLVYMTCKGAYALMRIFYLNQGYWYFPLSIFTINLLLIVLAWNWLAGHVRVEAKQFIVKLMAAIWILTYLWSSGEAINSVRWMRHAYSDFWTFREEITQGVLAADPHPKIIDNRDGFWAYGLDWPAVSCTGLVTDKQGLELYRQGVDGYLKHYIQQGYNVLPSHRGDDYLRPAQLQRNPGFKIGLIYRHEKSGIEFYRIAIAQ